MTTTTITVTSSHSWHKGKKLEIIDESIFRWTLPTGKIVHYDRESPEESCLEFVALFSILGIINDLCVEGCSLDELYRIVYSVPFCRNLIIVHQWKCDCNRNRCGLVINHQEKTFKNYGELFAGFGEPMETPLLTQMPYYDCSDSIFLSMKPMYHTTLIYGGGCKEGVTREFNPSNNEDKVYIQMGYDR